MRLQNKLVIITAAASGIGRAGVELFLSQGASVVAVDINAQALEELAAACRSHGKNLQTLVADLSDVDECRRCINASAELLGGLDVLWNHAGVPGPSDVENLDLELYEKSYAINVTSGIVTSGQAIAHMRERGGGSIVFTSSVSGIVGSMLSPIYSAQKFGVVGLTMSLAQRFAADKVRVNAICPGPVETPMLSQFLSRSDDPTVLADNRAKVLDAVPLRRLATPLEIAHCALWLASDDASYVTGIALPVDGGLTCR